MIQKQVKNREPEPAEILGFNVPGSFLFQWHITDRCNLRCRHCYQEKYGTPDPKFPDLLFILNAFETFLEHMRSLKPDSRIGAHLTVTGGEPFLRDDFFDLLDIFHKKNRKFSFSILTNGTLIDEKTAKRLMRFHPRFVQVSIDGNGVTHDHIRGRGAYKKAVNGLAALSRKGIPTFISFTAHRENFREFTDVCKLGKKLGVSRVWADRLAPFGSGKALSELVLTTRETRNFFSIMKQSREKYRRFFTRKSIVSMHRALQFHLGGGRPYNCTAGHSLVTVMPNGDLYPCRRLPVRVGNLFESSLTRLYYESELFQALRNPEQMDETCKKCFYGKLCRGGLRCLSYAVSGTPFGKDPGCWIIRSDSDI